MTTVTLMNPWSKAIVTHDASEIAAMIKAYPWPEEIIQKLDGQCDTDIEWVVEAVKLLGAEQAGAIILGS
jgi:hypothetical protein